MVGGGGEGGSMMEGGADEEGGGGGGGRCVWKGATRLLWPRKRQSEVFVRTKAK